MNDLEKTVKWEPGTVLQHDIVTEDIMRLDSLVSKLKGAEVWNCTRFPDGIQYRQQFNYGSWKVHRLPHEFRVGDCFECNWCRVLGRNKPRMVSRLDERGWLCVEGEKERHEPIDCRHVPPPKEVMPSEQTHRLGESVVTGDHRAVETSDNGLEFAEAYANENDDLPATAFIIRPLIARVKELERELAEVDETLSRRPALDDLNNRCQKIARACNEAGRANSLKAKLQSARQLAKKIRSTKEWGFSGNPPGSFPWITEWLAIKAMAREFLEKIK